MLASDQLEDKTAVEFLPDFIEWFCEMLRNPRLRPLGKFERCFYSMLLQKRRGLSGPALLRCKF